jgi:hypothetical protein
MELITPVPLPPHPMMPSRTGESEAAPNTVPGLRMVTAAEAAAAVFINVLRSTDESILLLLSMVSVCRA